MAKRTPATAALDRAGLTYSVHEYDYDSRADRIGVHAAQCLGVPPEIVLKTLVATVDRKPVCVLVPSNAEVSMKRLAGAFGGRSAQMSPPAQAERITGYRVGGISPFGQRRPLPTVIDESALEQEAVFLNGGQRGLQLRLSPKDAAAALNAKAAKVIV